MYLLLLPSSVWTWLSYSTIMAWIPIRWSPPASLPTCVQLCSTRLTAASASSTTIRKINRKLGSTVLVRLLYINASKHADFIIIVVWFFQNAKPTLPLKIGKLWDKQSLSVFKVFILILVPQHYLTDTREWLLISQIGHISMSEAQVFQVNSTHLGLLVWRLAKAMSK